MNLETITDTLVLELSTAVSDKRPVFITGEFCKWLPDLEEFRMKETEPGEFRFEFPDDTQVTFPIQYKYTRGAWNQGELDSYGKEHPNRYISKNMGYVHDKIVRWQTDLTEKLDQSPLIEIISETFEIPQLNTHRRIHVLLPHNYYEEPDRHYPVHYMMDAQNLFGHGSDYGNWQIDKSLTALAKEGKGNVIIVAVDHAEDARVQEFSPYDIPRLGKGKGALFLKFLAETLKPFIDQKYRTKSDRLNTGMGGSSVGGLLTIYAALMFPHVFGRLMIFSPSLWISGKIYFDAIHFFEPFETKIYLYGGEKEGNEVEQDNMITNMKRLNQTLVNQGFGYKRVEINMVIDPKGEHSETRWGEEFPTALNWLFEK